MSRAALTLTLLCAWPVVALGQEYCAIGGWVTLSQQDTKKPGTTIDTPGVGVAVEIKDTEERFYIKNTLGFFVIRAQCYSTITLRVTKPGFTPQRREIIVGFPRHLVEPAIEMPPFTYKAVGHLSEDEIRQYAADYKEMAERGRVKGDHELVVLGEENLRQLGDYARLLNEEAARVSADDPKEGERLHQRALWIHREAPTDEAAYGKSLKAYIQSLQAMGRDPQALLVLSQALFADASAHLALSQVATESGLRLGKEFFFTDEFTADRRELGALGPGKEVKTFAVTVRAGQATKFQIIRKPTDSFLVTIFNEKGETVFNPTILTGNDGITWTAAKTGKYIVQAEGASAATDTGDAVVMITVKPVQCYLLTCLPPGSM